jgi:hypothetical protein
MKALQGHALPVSFSFGRIAKFVLKESCRGPKPPSLHRYAPDFGISIALIYCINFMDPRY